MKSIKFPVFFLILVTIFSQFDSYSQCGPGVENIAITNYCDNQYASWTITNPQTGSSYRWNAASSYDVTNPGGTGTDYGYSNSFSSPTRLAHPTGTATGQVQYYYVKETSIPSLIPWPGSIASPGATTNTFSMTYTTTSVIRMNSVAVPIKVYNASNTYKTQIRIQGPSGLDIYSPVLSFLGSSATNISGQDYLVTVPVGLSLTSPGIYTMSVIPNPASGAGNNLDGMIWTNGAFAGASGEGINVRPGVLNPIYSGTNSSVIYNWNYTSYCGPNPSGFAFPTTTGCCSPIFINPTMGASDDIIQTGVDVFTITSVNLTECTGTGCYYQWYRNGVSIPGANGLNRTTFVATSSGVYTSRIVKSPVYINNISCYGEGIWNMDERAIFASVTAPGTAPYCIGERFYLNSTVDGINLRWSPSSGLSSSTTKATTYTANTTGSIQLTVSANILSNNKIINGNFETGVIGPSGSTQLSLQADPGNVDNSYAIRTSVPAQDNSSGNNSFWKSCSGDGYFFIGNAFNSSANSRLYSQNVTGLTPGQTYTLSFDITNISRNAAYNGTPTAADTDVRIAVIINNSSVGGILTAGANGDLNRVCTWTTNTVNWTAPPGVSSANIELRQVQLFSGGGLDFGLDNIRFGGLVTQEAKVTLGPIQDCSTIVAFASACSGTTATFTASVTGGMVFSRWERPLGTVISTNPVLSVTSATGGVYTAFGLLPLSNVLENGDFESGNTGFLNGNPTYFKYQANFGSGGDNAYTVTSNTQAGNGSWLTLTPPVSGTGTNIYVGDIKPPGSGKTGNKIVGWTFNATAGQSFLFNGYVANLHKDVSQTAFTVYSANIGIEIGTSTVTSLALASTNSWNFISGIWTAPTTGSFTLNVADYSSATAQAGFGNDIAIDNFSLRPLFGTFKTATVTGPVCVLSIELISFEVEKKTDGVHLNWTAYSSSSSQGYYVERSDDGVNFYSIGFVDFNSTKNGVSGDYEFIDKKPVVGVNYYRLKQIDNLGKLDYSTVKSIVVESSEILVFPNPSKGQLTVYVGSASPNAEITIYNALGSLVYTTSTQLNTIDLDIQKLASGLYTVLVSNAGITQTVKLVKE